MAMQSRNRKKITKKQAMQNIVDHYQTSLKDNFIKNMVMGFETASQMYLDKINTGCSMDELKDFIKKNIANKEVIERMMGVKYVETDQ